MDMPSPRWFVKSVRVEGLAGRKTTYEHELNPDVNIFFGLNGSGKTTLLRIIHCALNEELTPLIGAPFKHATVEIALPEHELIVVRSFDLPDDASFESLARRAVPPHLRNRPSARITHRIERQIQEYFSWDTTYSAMGDKSASVDIKNVSADFQHRYLPTSRVFDAQDITGDMGERSLDEYFADSIQRLWSSYSAEVLAAVRQAQEDGLGRILAGVISPHQTTVSDWEIDYDKAVSRVTKFLQRRGSQHLVLDKDRLRNRFQSDQVFKRVVLDINEVEERIEKALEPQTKLQTLVSRLITGPKQIDFHPTRITATTTSDRKEISLERLSSGERQLIRILVEALSAGGRPIIIDEPEISMHVDWQHVLIESIRTVDEDAQVITATHSPEIMAEITDERIFEL